MCVCFVKIPCLGNKSFSSQLMELGKDFTTVTGEVSEGEYIGLVNLTTTV